MSDATGDVTSITEHVPDPYGDGRRPLPAMLWIILPVVGAVAVAYAVWMAVGTDGIVSALSGYWPVLLSPVLGIVLGRMVARQLHSPAGRLLVNLDVDRHMFRSVFVPERMFRYLDQTGNNVVYHTPSGIPVYLVEGMDLVNGHVDYGWVHEADPMVVMTREETYRKWHDTLDEALAENLQLIANPKVIGLGYARRMLREHLDRISGAVGLDVPDYDHHSTFDEGSDQGDVSITDRDGQSGDGVPNVPFGGHGGERHG